MSNRRNPKRKIVEAAEVETIQIHHHAVAHSGHAHAIVDGAGSGDSNNININNNNAGGGNSNSSAADDHEVQTIRITARKNEFNKEHYWLVDLHAEPALKQGATPLVRRCMKAHGWDESYCRRVLRAYRQFLYIKEKKKDWNAVLLSPSIDVEGMWHQHILDVNNYIHDCMLLCGHVLGHNPDNMLYDNIAKKGCRYSRTKLALEEYYELSELDTNRDGVWKEVFHQAIINTPISQLLHGEEMNNTSESGSNNSSDASMTIILRNTVNNNDEDTYYNIKMSTEFRMVFEAYAQRVGVPESRLRFTYQGMRIDPEAIPNQILDVAILAAGMESITPVIEVTFG